jgi:hypothetical protein
MRNRPRKLIPIAALLLCASVFVPLKHLLEGVELTRLDEAALALAPLTAWLVVRASPWVLAFVPGLGALITLSHLRLALEGGSADAIPAMAATMAYLAGILGFMTTETLWLAFNPQWRWWLTPPRLRAEIPVRVKLLSQNRIFAQGKRKDGTIEFYAKTFDISAGGAFIPKALEIGTQCYVCIPLRGLNYIQCRAEVVRSAPAQGKYPAGSAVRFLGLSWGDRRQLHQYVNDALADALIASERAASAPAAARSANPSSG